MIDHFSIKVSDIEKSKLFYRKTLGALGYVPIIDKLKSASFRVKDGFGICLDPGGDFWISEGTPASPRVHFAFGAASRANVDAFYASGMAAGGIENGAPGLRTQYHPAYYAAFLLDPDGYNIEAVCHTA
jgi:catechol 2,3-dioxygenase-like lactoylglutathione lyase family enzyme